MRDKLTIALLLVGCGGGSSAPPDAAAPPADAAPAPDGAVIPDGGGAPDADPALPQPSEDWTRDILDTSVELDLTAHTGVATMDLAPSASSTGASFDVRGLTVTSVGTGTTGLDYAVSGTRLDVGVPTGGAPRLVVAYTWVPHTGFDGYHPTQGLTFLWPYFCGNLFPCHPDPDDGTRFELAVTGAPAGDVLVYPATIAAQAPSYMIALAHGDYQTEVLGTTPAGTQVSVWYYTGERTAALAGAATLPGYVDFYETSYGPYPFGAQVGSVSANWGAGAYGGMEHHPYWHVARGAMDDPEVHAHEAAHGWYGNGIRIRCWEDFVLSEGTVSYLAARAIEDVDGAPAGGAIWSSYQSRLNAAGAGIAWPDTCNAIDILGGLFSDLPYMRGAFFYREVEQEPSVGRAELDLALQTFYASYAGQAAGMQDMLDTILAVTGFDATALANTWLRSAPVPTP